VAAKIEAVIEANIGPFQKALKEATEGAHKFGEAVSEVGTGVGKNLVGIDVGKLLGFAGAIAAADILSEKLIEVAKEGLGAFAEHETQVLSLKLNIKGATDEIAEGMLDTLESMAGVGGTTAQLVSAFRSLKQAGLGDAQALATIKDLQNYYIQTTVAVDDYAESLRKAQAGGAEGGEGLSKLLKTMPNVASMIQEKINKEAEDYQAEHRIQAVGSSGGIDFHTQAESDEYNKRRMMTPADFVSGHHLDFEQLLKDLHTHAPAHAVEEASKTLTGMQADLKAKIEQMFDAIGKPLAPAAKAFLDEVTASLPGFTKEITAVTEAMGPPILDALRAFAGALGAATNVLVKNQTEQGKTDVDFESGLRRRGSLNAEGNYVYGHQPGQKAGEGSMDAEKHLFQDMWDDLKHNANEAFGTVVPGLGAMEARVAQRNIAGGLTADGRLIVDAIKDQTKQLSTAPLDVQ
jgi:hypothetical protein